MQYIMFTKHLEGLDVGGIIRSLKSAGVSGADLCVRSGYPVSPENIATALPDAARQFADAGLSIPLVTAPGDFNTVEVPYADEYYAACGEAGVKHVKIGYWHWTAEMDYWTEVDNVRRHLDGFQALSMKHGVQTVVHNHSGHSMGLNSSSAMNLVRGFDPNHIGIFADVGHLSICGEPIDMALNIVKDYLSVMSFKDLARVMTMSDGKRPWGMDVVRIGHGFGDWQAVLTTLDAMDYSGPVSFHSEYGGEPVDSVIDLARMDVRYIDSLRV